MNVPIRPLSAMRLDLPEAVALVSEAAFLSGGLFGPRDIPRGAGAHAISTADGLREKAFRAMGAALAWDAAHPDRPAGDAEAEAWAEVKRRGFVAWAEAANAERRALAQADDDARYDDAHRALAERLRDAHVAPIRDALLARLPVGLRAGAEDPGGPSVAALDTLARGFGGKTPFLAWVNGVLGTSAKGGTLARTTLAAAGVLWSGDETDHDAGLRATLATILRAG